MASPICLVGQFHNLSLATFFSYMFINLNQNLIRFIDFCRVKTHHCQKRLRKTQYSCWMQSKSSERSPSKTAFCVPSIWSGFQVILVMTKPLSTAESLKYFCSTGRKGDRSRKHVVQVNDNSKYLLQLLLLFFIHTLSRASNK